MTKGPVNEPAVRHGLTKKQPNNISYSHDEVVSKRAAKARTPPANDVTAEGYTNGQKTATSDIAKSSISQEQTDTVAKMARKTAAVTRNNAKKNTDQGTTSSRPDSKLFVNASDNLIKKLAEYRAAFIKCLARVYDGDLNPAAAMTVLSLPLKELASALIRDRGTTKVSAPTQNACFSEYIYNDTMLALCFMGKAKALNATEAGMESLTEFIYCHAMRADYLMENSSNFKAIELMGTKRVVPKKPQILFKVWETLLGISPAKERKLRLAFTTITQLVMMHALKDDIHIPETIRDKHTDTFIALLADPNKELRYRCMQLLEHFQDERVKKEIERHLGDHAAAVRLVAVSSTKVPDDIEALVPVLNKLIARLGDVSREVRAGVYKKLGTVYSAMPVEICTHIMCYGLEEEAQNVKNAFLQMLQNWMDESGGLLKYIADMISQTDDITVLEGAISFYMKNTDFLCKFSLKPGSTDGNMKEKDESGTDTTNNIKAYMKRFLTLTPAELVLVSIFYQNHALPDEVKLINIIDVISYAHFLLTRFCEMPIEQEQVPQRAITATADDDMQFVDAMETNEAEVIHKYTPEEESKMKANYQNMCLVSHALRALLVIMHGHNIEDNYQVALVETMCDNILMHGPVRNNVKGLMTDIVTQTSLGNNAYYHALPSRWLKAGFIFAAASLLRYVYARKFRLEGKFIGDDPQMEKRHFEVSMTRKVLAIISDVKDPFQTSGISNVSIRREELERMELNKIKMFDPTSYSIEHLNLINAKLSEQMEQTWTQQAELENVKSASKDSKHEQEVLHNQEQALALLMEKQEAFASVIRRHLKERWTRIMAIVEAFLGQTQSLCSEDAGLAEFPRAILLPQMAFFCSTVVRWHDQSVTDQYCDVLTSKCLGTWCMLNNGKMELWRQLNAFHVALKGALVILEGFLNQANDASAGLTDALRKRIEMQTLRCEMYMTTLTDLLVTNVELQQMVSEDEIGNHELIDELKETLWGIVFCTVKSSKYVQSIALRLGCKLLLTEFMMNKRDGVDMQPPEEIRRCDELAVVRLRGLLELVFVPPAAERHLLAQFKFLKSNRHIPITAEDKNAIVSTCAIYPTLSFRHLRNFHKVLEQVLMRSIHHALQLDLRMTGFAHLISFVVQTILHRSPLYFSMESFAKYFKWLLLITIDKGAALADRGGFMSLITAVITMFIKHNVTGLIDKFGQSEAYGMTDDEPRSMSDLCAMANPQLALLDLRDMRVLLNFMTQGGFVRAKANVKLLENLTQLVSAQMLKIARTHAVALANTKGTVYVEAGNPLKIVFATEDSAAFSDLVDAYDAYIASLGSRELSAMLVELDEEPPMEEKVPIANRRTTRTTRVTKSSQKEANQDDVSDGSDEDMYDDEYVLE
ncbi:uncharacterized protein BXIN_2110 [Babesia sp. Xinjiang]|uniref:uncharacterized protein n=1 Tax=Babesia sp. Xinjiang TaxID=462227 RepID=UPI000A2597F8|nr:uncharacterized protein BXIN_2110 [Babesia sp. Xinjiang]ORM40590.1 hypothetical protein BXIN_2110 [Babesia sp. Xinjiang]